jgi:hypothetical protein
MDARKEGYIVIVEESDCWALWFHGIPAMGIPGADMVEDPRSTLTGSPGLRLARTRPGRRTSRRRSRSAPGDRIRRGDPGDEDRGGEGLSDLHAALLKTSWSSSAAMVQVKEKSRSSEIQSIYTSGDLPRRRTRHGVHRTPECPVTMFGVVAFLFDS